MKRLFGIAAAAAIVVCTMVGCSKVEYDFKTLGFASKDEMQAAFDKGYHTKQKLNEMVKPAPIPAAVSQAPVPQAVVTPSPQPTQQQPQAQQQPQESNSAAVVAAASTCDSVKACADAMLDAAKTESISSAMEAARRIDAMPKPQRGDRKLARKLNTEGLDSLKQRKLADAAASLTKALEADPLDEEILSNLIYTYNEDGNFNKAEQLAYKGLLLNPRRANIWLSIAIVKQKQGKASEAIEAMWITWQFSEDKEKLSALLNKRIEEDTDAGLKKMYVNAKAWTIDGKKPSF